jgi:hypothetical protein
MMTRVMITTHLNRPILSTKIEGDTGAGTNPPIEVIFIKTTPHSNMVEVGAVKGVVHILLTLFLNEGAEAILEAHLGEALPIGVNIEAHPNQEISHKGAEAGAHPEGAP